MRISSAIRRLTFLVAGTMLSAGGPLAAQHNNHEEGRDKDERQPLALATQGNFFVGGHYFTVDGQQYMSGQIYVDYQIPQKVRHKYPVVLIHGGGLTGSYMSGTADGREGWNSFFLRQGYAVYVIDQPGRGRSVYHADVYGGLNRGAALGLEQRFTKPELYNLWPQARLHTQWPGFPAPASGRIGDPIFDTFFGSEVQSISSTLIQQTTMRDAGAALLDKIGPAILLTHSQSGPYGWFIADARPNLVKGVVAVEPSGPPFVDVQQIGPPTWYADGNLTRPYGITTIPITYSPAVSNPAQLTFTLQATPDRDDLVRCRLQTQPARQLPTLQRIPIVIVASEASYHAGYDHCTSKYLTQAGVRNTFVRLEDVGIHGNGHMMMIEKNNAKVAAFLESWISRNVR
jgi:pimeloyl-ACP methyl ester carboxylesterase